MLLARSQALDKPLPAVGAQQVLDATALLSNRSSLSTAEAHALRVAEQDCLGDAASGPTTDGSAAAGSAAMGAAAAQLLWIASEYVRVSTAMPHGVDATMVIEDFRHRYRTEERTLLGSLKLHDVQRSAAASAASVAPAAGSPSRGSSPRVVSSRISPPALQQSAATQTTC